MNEEDGEIEDNNKFEEWMYDFAWNPSFPPKNQNHHRRAACFQNFRYLLVVIFFI